ncbi:hypothetical protein BU26DRAFT_585811 [Trematosphaeria pertusa]|uniref:Uncharacterized protein n=1 Tax=Trematosphaeria pertusa TaxID=390896 RepID=A0A6A6HT38_9PLEO|nr:uncharacterized protein BU26DRAFT_585811 [Trematosphaeria pertusa]KAF2241335.1 hypothetical protein BU26DRAFT_585811 [Trematosphaeria pertusa]
MEEWRRAGPLEVLLDVISSICTPQARQLLEDFQRDSNSRSGDPTATILKLVKPVKTRWNSYYDCFARAIKLRNALDDYVAYKTNEYQREAAKRRYRVDDDSRKKPRLFIEESCLTRKD